MKLKACVFFLAFMLLLSPLAFSQSRSTGAIVGTVMDDQGEPLPGVTVTLESPNLIGVRSAITDSSGGYRFPALPPGLYTITVELPGFNTVVQEEIRVTTTVRLTVDITMQPTSVQEQVTVIAESPTVDVKSSETASVTLSDEILRNIPFSNFAMDIVNLAPGVTDNVAYGASQNTGVSYQLDGVDVSDPEAGSAWVFNDPNIIEEAKIMGIGLPAEYGNFTGVIFNQVTKSGGNEFSGYAQFIYQGKGKLEENDEGYLQNVSSFWMQPNNDAYIDDFPGLSSPLEAVTDFALNMGGPIIKDKIWFFLGGQYYRSEWFPTGFPEAVDYKQPRAFVKITSQLSPSTNINTFYEFDAYQGQNRGASATTHPDACVTQDSPDNVGNFSITQILSEKTFFDLKASFFIGRYYLDPEVGTEINAHYDVTPGVQLRLTDSAGYFFYADRSRYQANTSLTHFAEDFIAGDHDFKFGAEFEYGKVRNQYGYTGKDNIFYVDYTGYGPYGYYYNGPYLAYQYEGYDSNTQYTRLEEFAQDSWKISDRLNLNLGIRFTHVWGTVKGVDGNVYTNNRIAPRLGFTFDLLGDKTTILKGHYGQFTEAMLASYHDRLNPPEAYSDYNGYYWDPINNVWVPWFSIEHENLYSLDPDLNHPYMNQFTFGIERELFKDASFGATFIYRDWKNIIGRIDEVANYFPVNITVPEFNNTGLTVYGQTNVGEHQYLLTNITQDSSQWIMGDPYRNYWAIELLFNKRFSNKWQLLASYVYSQATGTIDNGFADDIGWGGSTDNPNYWINADGNSSNDPTHMLKVQGTYVLPYGIQLNAHFRAITGYSWENRYRYRLPQGIETIMLEPRGSQHLPMQKILDMRLEKTFDFAQRYRLGFMLDVFNVLNDDTPSSWGDRIGYDYFDPSEYPSTDGHYLYDIVNARQIRLGIRFMF
jgi:hypothetical protein